jgi:hypothetical protein
MNYLLAIDWGFILEKLILIAVIITASLIIAMYATYAERKVAAVIRTGVALTVLAHLAFCSHWQME